MKLRSTGSCTPRIWRLCKTDGSNNRSNWVYHSVVLGLEKCESYYYGVYTGCYVSFSTVSSKLKCASVV